MLHVQTSVYSFGNGIVNQQDLVCVSQYMIRLVLQLCMLCLTASASH